jgi:hypothetical protein
MWKNLHQHPNWNAMNEFGTDLDSIVEDIVARVSDPLVPKRRVDDDRKLNGPPCT